LDKRDVVVIGGGGAGYVAAGRAAQLGGKTTLVEKEMLGGVCVNWGCIPMQFLLRNAALIQLMKKIKEDGINIGKVDIDYSKLMAAKRAVVKSVVDHIQDNLKANNVEIVKGWGRLTSPNRVEIELDNGSRQVFSAKKVILAPGSVPKRLSVPGAEGERVITMKEALEINPVPKSAVAIGGGVIGLELATFWASLGCAVSIVEVMPRTIPNEDHEVASFIEQALREDGIQIYTGAEVNRIDDVKGGKSVTISRAGAKHKLEAEVVVFTIGHSPSVEGLGLEDIGVVISRGRIQTNKRMETSVKGVYAAGDTTGEIMLASVAMVQGTIAAENAMGRDSTMDYRVVPRGIRTLPEVGAVGITEQEARKEELDVKVSKYPFASNTKAPMLREGSGFIKVIANSASGEILGVHIIGPQATELIHEAAIAMQMRGTVQDVAAAIHSHPCLHEAMQRAAQSLCPR
jgi:dihydrolipoamide dehydrogenase